MPDLRILKVVFDTEIEAWEIPAFRGAVNEMLGKKILLFHNHLGKDEFYYHYPLIQYKRLGKKPMILCLGEGVDEMHHFFNKRMVMLSIGGKIHEMKIDNLNLSGCKIELTPALHHYSISNWVALNQKNYQQYMAIESVAERHLMLEKILTGNILSLAKGIGYIVAEAIQIRILGEISTRLVSLKGQKVMAFNVDFGLNMSLPPYIGLGKSPSIGFGMVRSVKSIHL